jgi:hypothetical protein
MSLGRELPLDAGAAVGSDDGGMPRSRWQDEPVAGLHRKASLREDELDGATGAIEDLCVSVLVLAVRVARCVGPPVDVTSFAAECGLEGPRIGRRRTAIRMVLGMHG